MKENVFIVPEGIEVIARGTIPRDVTKVVIPDTVIEIGDDAFNLCRTLNSLVIPNTVTAIGNSTFKGCSALKTINIPGSITSMGDCVFDDCTSLKCTNIPEGVPIGCCTIAKYSLIFFIFINTYNTYFFLNIYYIFRMLIN